MPSPFRATKGPSRFSSYGIRGMLLRREIHWIFVVFERSRMKALSGQAEEQNKTGAASLRRQSGFDAEPSQAPSSSSAGSGFGRRKTPIPETTDGLPPRAAANDRGARNADAAIALGRSFGLQAAHDETSERHAVPVAIDDVSHGLLAWLQDELRSGRKIQ